jgi:hypothetical protein
MTSRTKSGDVTSRRKHCDLVIRILQKYRRTLGGEQLSCDARSWRMFADVLDAACKLYEHFPLLVFFVVIKVAGRGK